MRFSQGWTIGERVGRALAKPKGYAGRAAAAVLVVTALAALASIGYTGLNAASAAYGYGYQYEHANLIVIKHVIGDGATASSFHMSTHGTNASPADGFPGAESPGTNVTLDPGSYNVTETGPSGYTPSFSADCSGTIANSETKTCTVTNHVDCSAATLLAGTKTLARSGIDNDVAGLAEAFRATADASGTANVVCVYLDPTNAATHLVAGIYDNSGGHPGSLLVQGTNLGPLINGAVNTVIVPSVPLAAGTRYWITVLSPFGFGTLRFRDHCCGYQSQTPTNRSENSKQLTLTSLPAVWSTGLVWPKDGPLLGWSGG